jgi:hypothetical protein
MTDINRPHPTKKPITVDYLVDFTITVPDDTSPAEFEERTTDEGTRVAELAKQGHALRVWKPLPEDGRRRARPLPRRRRTTRSWRTHDRARQQGRGDHRRLTRHRRRAGERLPRSRVLGRRDVAVDPARHRPGDPDRRG